MKFLATISLIFMSCHIFAANSANVTSGSLPVPPPQDEDTMFFDINNSTVTQATGFSYLDIPVFVKTTINPFSFDFWFKFNETKLTYDSTISLFSELDTYTNFNTSNHFLQNTTSGPSISYQVPNNTTLVILRFVIADPCVGIDASDFYQITTLMDGVVCNHKFLANSASFVSNTSAINCTNATVDFTFPAALYGKNILTWDWDFGNGVSGSIQNPSVQYLEAGTFPVSVNITTEGGCAYSFVENTVVYESPVADFSYVADPVVDSVFFTNIVAVGFPDNLSFSWNFGDGGTSTLLNPSHQYASGGNFNVSLVATSSYGCYDTRITTIIVDKPTASYTYTGSCAGSMISFLDNSVYSTGTITSRSWDFGDGTAGSGLTPNHIYNFAGSYTVTLTVTSATGSYGTYSSIVEISTKPLVQFLGDVLSGCSPLTVNFTDLSVAQVGATYQWNFGDNSSASAVNTSHTYLVGGVFPVKLVITTLNGCTDSLTKNSYINVTTAATANFSSTDGCRNSVINFVDNSTIASGNIIGWQWSFGDGTSSTSQNPTKIYAVNGSYTVVLKAFNELGCEGSITKSIIVNEKPTIQFTSTDLTGCTPLTSSFQNLSGFATGSQFMWNFGDGGISSNQHPSHIFTNDGYFDISLTIIAPGGCRDSLKFDDYIHVFDAVQSNFSTGNRCVNSATVFTDISTTTNGTIDAWNWDFGNGNSSSSENPSYVYTSPGIYSAVLTVSSDDGCSSTVTKDIKIDAMPVANFAVNDSLGCENLMVQFTDQSTTATGSTYSWNLGDNTTSTDVNPSHNYTLNGFYTIKQIVTSPEGCVDSIVKTNFIAMQSQPSTTISASSLTAVLPKSIIDFSSQSLNYTELIWNFGDDYFSNLENPSHDFLDTGNYEVCLTALSSYGCADTSCLEITILASNPIAVPSAFTPNGDGNNDQFTVQGGPFLEFEMKILNEWGNVVFTSATQNSGWNGKIGNTDQPVGVYEYIVTGKTLNTENINLYGVVNLTR